MPVPLLIALFLAFGFSAPWEGVAEREAASRVLEAAAGVAGVGLAAIGLGSWVAWRVSVFGYMTTRMRRLHQLGGRLLAPLALAVYCWILFGLGWGEVVERSWNLDRWFLVEHLAILAPFAVMQASIWCGGFLVERAVSRQREPSRTMRLRTYLALKSRNALGLTLPVILVFLVRYDVVARIWPAWTASEFSEPIDFAILGCIILCASPLFVRIAFPTRPLPDGPLRRRLEHLAGRVGFRYRDVLVWDTDQTMINACVTGVLPGFRYVLLTDALIDSLEPREISAVFGHEIGHIAHRHLPYYGFFFLGSLGVLTLASVGAAGVERWLSSFPAFAGLAGSSWTGLIEAGLVLAAAAAFFGLAFGHLSRRLERQADVFGCSVVSCDRPGCPPHNDPDENLFSSSSSSSSSRSSGCGVALPCPAGVQIFSKALGRVARHNGMEFRARSWRHGSIAGRIAFIESLRGNPAAAQQFERAVGRLRFRWGVLLSTAILLAIGAYAFSLAP